MAHNEQIFTPHWVVDLILDKIGYIGFNIRKKHIIDNSCGDGAFLVRIIQRYFNYCHSLGMSIEEIVDEISTYVHGIEVDERLLIKCNNNLQYAINEKCLHPINVQLNLVSGDALTTNLFDNKMDFVVGNPPYCKIHDMDDDKRNIVKSFRFTQDSNTDLYLAFFEKGIKMLNDEGILAYITPNSWMTSKAGREFRNYLFYTKSLSHIIQFGNEKIFDNATTFTNITVIDKNKENDKFRWQNGKDGEVVETDITKVFINNCLYLGSDKQLDKLNKILNYPLDKCKVNVKNGFATLKDKLFINVNDANIQNTSKNYIPIIKASLGKTYMAVFPYDTDGIPHKFEQLDELTQKYLIERAFKLEVDMNKPNWYLYGRNQSINDVYKEKIAISNLIKDISTLKINKCPKGTGVYSGLYIVSNTDEEIDYNRLLQILNQEDFIENYVKLLGKYKNGGYYAFSSDDLKRYLNYCY